MYSFEIVNNNDDSVYSPNDIIRMQIFTIFQQFRIYHC